MIVTDGMDATMLPSLHSLGADKAQVKSAAEIVYNNLDYKPKTEVNSKQNSA